jgi:type VI secretion system protein ImpA
MAQSLEPNLEPISPEEPCGPDLDMEGDPEFMNFLAEIEGLLPASYFSFDRKTIDFNAALETAAKLKTRTHDLRLMLIVARLALLNRDFSGFAREVAAVAWALTHYWDEIHPRAERGQYAARLAQLGTLNDGPTVVLPLQYAPLLRSDREGPLAYRAVMVKTGEAQPREGEKLASAAVIDRILDSAEIATLADLHAALTRLAGDLAGIVAITAERIDHAQAVRLDAVTPLVEKMLAFAQGALARRDPSLAAAPEAPESEGETPAGPANFETLADVDSALAAALGYFQTREPSNPASLLIAQARATLGKNLYEVMRLLAPRHADNARVFVGPSDAFSIPVSALQDAPALDFSFSEAEPAESRASAFSLMEQVATHLRAVEPSNPAPYLLDRARALATRDFLSLLAEVFAADDLESMKNGG